jgi:DNA-binding transcriptional MerR regulator
MRIGEVADRLGLNPRTIRYYEAIGLLPEPERTASGYRVYDESTEDVLVFIKSAQCLGITLDEVREILAFRERGEEPCAYVRAVLRREVAEIDRRIDELQQLRRSSPSTPSQRPCPRAGRCVALSSTCANEKRRARRRSGPAVNS